MMPAAKHGDPQVGVDIHLCVVPPSPSPVPLPTPHTSIVFDPFDYVPILGATVTVCGMKRAVAGTSAKAIHIPPGFPFAPKIPDTSDEVFMGSATVVADGDPFSFLSVPVLSCQVAGMLSPPRLKQHEKKLMLLPTTVNIAIPTNVFIGGPPTISMMGMAFKFGFAALGKLAKSRFGKALASRFAHWRKTLFGHLKPGFLKCIILRAEPVNIVSGAVSVEQEDFTLPGLIPLQWVRRYGSDNVRRGACGVGWDTPADVRLSHDGESGVVLFHGLDGQISVFPRMPASLGGAGAVLELMDGALISDHQDELLVRTKEDRLYRFPKHLGFATQDGQNEYRLGQIDDLCGNSLFYDRDGERRLLAIRDQAGRRIVADYGDDGLICRVSLQTSKEFCHVYVEYSHDGAGNLLEVRDALGQPYRFAYHGRHMVCHTDRNGLSFYYEYDTTDDERRVAKAWGDGGLYDYRFAYFDAVNERRITDSLGNVSVVTLDERGLPIRELDPLGGVTTFEYDEAGRTTAVTDQDGLRTEYAYDERGNLLHLLRSDGSTVEIEYDASNKPVSFTEPNGARWSECWDSRGLLLEQKSPLGHTWRYEHDGRGGLASFVGPRGARTRLRCNDLGYLVEWTDALGHRTDLAYDDLGRLSVQTDPLGRTTRYVYDPKSRLVANHLPSGAVTRCDYDAEDNLVRYDEAGQATHHLEYVGVQKVSRFTDQAGNEVHCQYDAEEQLIGAVNARGETYRLTRDALGRVVEEIDYWGQRTVHQYTPGGRLYMSIDPQGCTLRYVTDPLGRMLERALLEPGAKDPSWRETFAYDPNGQLVAAENPSVRIERSYDAEGRLVSEKQGAFCSVRNSYDACGNRVERRTEVAVDGVSVVRTVGYTYDALDRLVRVVGGDAGHITFERNAVGQLVAERLGLNLQRETRFNADGEVQRRRVRGDGGTIFDIAYGHDAAGNLIERRDANLGVDMFAYDPVRRLTRHLDPLGRVQRYFTRPADGAVGILAFLPKAERATAPPTWFCEKNLDNGALHFDRIGNLVHRIIDGRETTFAWDALGRLLESRSDEGEITQYSYDALGRRIAKRTGERCTWFGWDADGLLCEATTPGTGRTPVCEWIYGSNMFEPLAAVLGDAAGSAQPEVFYYNNDPNGCPHRVLDATGQIVWSATYSAWGEVLALQVNRFDNPLRYQGQYYDGETGLSYNRFRYYDAKAAQYISPDTIRLEGGGDLYAYCANPHTFIDPLGLKCEKFIRFVSEAEAKALEAAMAAGQKPGLLPRPQGKGAFSRAAKWISELGHGRNPKKLGEGYTHKVEMELEEGTKAWLNDASRKVDYEKMAGGEKNNMGKILTKANEPGSYGVGRDLLDDFNGAIKKMTISKI